MYWLFWPTCESGQVVRVRIQLHLLGFFLCVREVLRLVQMSLLRHFGVHGVLHLYG